MDGWIKLHRCALNNPIVCKDSDYFAVWCYLLLEAAHTPKDAVFNGERITLKEGQLLTGRNAIAKQFKINPSKVQRIMQKLESEHQIEQLTGNKNRLVSIHNWGLYQEVKQQGEQQLNNNCTTTEQQVNTNKNIRIKELKNEKNKEKKSVGVETSFSQADHIKEQSFSPELEEKLLDWLRYKNERKEPYKEIGLKSLCTQIVNMVNEYGEVAVVDLMVESMANGWKGIAWVKLKTASHTKTFSQPVKQNRFVNYTQRDWDFVELDKLQRAERDKW